MESVIEDQRSKHEERERIEDTLVKEMLAKKATVSILLLIFRQNLQTMTLFTYSPLSSQTTASRANQL